MLSKSVKAKLRKLSSTLDKRSISIAPSTKLLTVNVHKIQDHMKCKRYYYWRWVLNLVPRKMNLAFWFGTIVHRAMEEYVENKSIAQIHKVMDATSKELIKKSMTIVQSNEELDIQLRVAKKIIEVYFDLYSKDLKTHKTVAVEQSFEKVLNQSPILFVGTLDWRGIYEKQRAIKEYKTASRITNEYFQRLVFDKQLNGYAIGYKELTGKYPTICPYTVFRKPGIKCRQTETPDDYITRLEADLYERAEWYFITEDIKLREQNILAVEQDIEWETYDMYSKYDTLTEDQLLNPFNWSRNDRSCFEFGCCPYFMLCNRCTTYKTYLPFFQMRDIRYALEHEELNHKCAMNLRANPLLTMEGPSDNEDE